MLSARSSATLRDLLNLAWPVVLARIGIMTMGLTDAIVVGNHAARELAYHSLAWAPTAVLVGRAYGALDARGVLWAGLVGLAVTAALTLLVALVVWPGAGLVIRAYTHEEAVAAVAIPALILATLFFVADGIQVVAAQALRAAGDVWWPTIMHFVSYGLVMIPVGWVLAHTAGLGVNGIVWAVILASLVSAVLLGGRFLRVARRASTRA